MSDDLSIEERVDFDRMALFAVVSEYGWSDFELGGTALGWIIGNGFGPAFIEFMKKVEDNK